MNGVRGRGLAKGYFFKHINNRHVANGAKFDRCRDIIKTNGAVHALWEEALSQLKMWLCTLCMHPYGWRKCCKVHEGVVIPAPFNDKDVDFLIHGITKPPEEVSVSPHEDIFVDDEHRLPSLDVDLLDKVFRSQIRTIRHIPAKCRLNFSRDFKHTMDGVISNLMDISSWVKFLLFLMCILTNYIPKCSFEESLG